MFWIGLLIGLIAGFALGLFIVSLCVAGKSHGVTDLENEQNVDESQTKD